MNLDPGSARPTAMASVRLCYELHRARESGRGCGLTIGCFGSICLLAALIGDGISRT